MKNMLKPARTTILVTNVSIAHLKDTRPCAVFTTQFRLWIFELQHQLPMSPINQWSSFRHAFKLPSSWETKATPIFLSNNQTDPQNKKSPHGTKVSL